MRVKDIYPTLPKFFATCDKCHNATSSQDLYAVVDQPWAYVCEPCAEANDAINIDRHEYVVTED